MAEKWSGYPIGCKFKYNSRYGGFVEGIIEKYYPSDNHLISGNIVSTNGVSYSLRNIEIESISEWRERRLKDLGL